jgi:hypothetical protein
VLTRTGGKYLTELNETFYLAYEDRLFLSKQSDPHTWNPLHNMRFEGIITGIAKLDDSLIIFVGNGSTWIVTGTIADNNIAKRQIPTTQGCPNWATIAYANSTPLWQSDDGICGIIRRPLGQGWNIEVITKGRYVFDSQANFALTHKDTYYLFFNDHCVIFDTGRNLIYRRSITADYGFNDNINGILYLVEDGSFFSIDTGNSLSVDYKSPSFGLNDLTEPKSADMLRVNADDNVTCSVWYDDVSVISDVEMSVEDNSYCLRLPPNQFYRIQIGLKSKGKIRGYTFNWDDVN